MHWRVGTGYDVHALVVGRPLILGGVTIPHTHGLAGHSDADVLTHAITDAILGSLALGDLGTHFPSTDPKFANANSLDLLAAAVAMLAEHGWKIANVDATVIAQAPQLAPHREAMQTKLASACGIEKNQVSVKATTTEGLGFIGNNEGIAATSVVLVTQQQG